MRRTLLGLLVCDAGLFAVGVAVDRQRKADLLGVAAADIEMIEINEAAQDVDDPQDALVPVLFARFLERPLADVLVIGLVAMHRVMGEFEMMVMRPLTSLS